MHVLTPTLFIVLFYSFFVSWIFKFKSLLITFLLHSSSFFIFAPSGALYLLWSLNRSYKYTNKFASSIGFWTRVPWCLLAYPLCYDDHIHSSSLPRSLRRQILFFHLYLEENQCSKYRPQIFDSSNRLTTIILFGLFQSLNNGRSWITNSSSKNLIPDGSIIQIPEISENHDWKS